MKSLPTHNANNVAAIDERDPNAGGASHCFVISRPGAADNAQTVQFQHGARSEPGSTAGAFDDDLLAILQDRLEAFQAGPFACPENGDALEHVKSARDALALRVARRLAQGVLGKNQRHE